jgi:acetyl-CoA carboxylase biotin carboxyl carrier protein
VTLTAKDVAEITRLLDESSFDELTLELDGLRVSLRRAGAAAPHASAGSPAPQSPQRPQAAAAEKMPEDAARAAPATPAATPAVADSGAQNVTAPLLGTFYRAPKPGAPPFVEVGSAVDVDTIIGIIEVMKLMNTVRAGTRGKVLDILAQDGALVEYGETLLRVSKMGGS